jgi:23S rRNA pseudouridine1911/1915/1917 synthase
MPWFPLDLTTQVPRNARGFVLLDYLSQRFDYRERSYWLEQIESGLLKINGAGAKPTLVLKGGESVTHHIPAHFEPEVPTEIQHIATWGPYTLFHKPAGLPFSRSGPLMVQNFANLVKERFDSNLQALHRLDRETSGIIVCHQGNESNGLQKQFSALLCRKIYLALVEGCLPHPVSVFAPLREAGETHPIPLQMIPCPQGKSSQTTFYPLGSDQGQTLVLVELFSGRKHQIRAHASLLDTPLIGG